MNATTALLSRERKRLLEDHKFYVAPATDDLLTLLQTEAAAEALDIARAGRVHPGGPRDVTIEAQIIELIRALRSDYAGTILFISHSLGLVAELCDEVVVMYAGTVVESGPSAAVFAKPQHPYTRALLECELDLQDGADRFVPIQERCRA